MAVVGGHGPARRAADSARMGWDSVGEGGMGMLRKEDKGLGMRGVRGTPLVVQTIVLLLEHPECRHLQTARRTVPFLNWQ